MEELKRNSNIGIIIDPARPLKRIPLPLKQNMTELTDIIEADLIRNQVELICRATSATSSRSANIRKKTYLCWSLI